MGRPHGRLCHQVTRLVDEAEALAALATPSRADLLLPVPCADNPDMYHLPPPSAAGDEAHYLKPGEQPPVLDPHARYPMTVGQMLAALASAPLEDHLVVDPDSDPAQLRCVYRIDPHRRLADGQRVTALLAPAHAPGLAATPTPLSRHLEEKDPQMRPTIDVRTATAADSDRAARVLGAAFAGLAASMWLAPDRTWRNQQYWRFFQLAYVDPVLTSGNGEVYITVDELAVAVWLRVEPNEDHTPGEEHLDQLREVTGVYAPNFLRFGDLLDEAHTRYATRPHDYLGVIGAHPTVWRKGNATALMGAHLPKLDRDRRPAYLEAAGVDLVPIWQKFGFEVVGEVRLPNGHVMYPMLREPAP